LDVFVTIALSPGVNPAEVDLSHVLVMLEFTLDRPLPASGEVVPVLSLPARVQLPRSGGSTAAAVGAGIQSEEGGAYDRVAHLCEEVHATCVRQINVSLSAGTDLAAATGEPTAGTFPVYALESPGYLGIAGKVWDSMYVLLQYLSQHTNSMVRGKRVVELGCGTGLAGESHDAFALFAKDIEKFEMVLPHVILGISLCTMEPRSVILTDMPEVVSLISANVLMNSVLVPDPHIRAVLRDRYRAAAYAWGERLVMSPAQDASGPRDAAVPSHPYFDLILASDVVYYPEGYAPLITTLCDLLTARDPEAADASTETCCGDGPVCILAHRHRHPEDKNFFDALNAAPQLQVRKLDFQADHAGQAGSVQALNDVLLFEIKRRL
jgi:predicted nicotinamide N-methyase